MSAGVAQRWESGPPSEVRRAAERQTPLWRAWLLGDRSTLTCAGLTLLFHLRAGRHPAHTCPSPDLSCLSGEEAQNADHRALLFWRESSRPSPLLTEEGRGPLPRCYFLHTGGLRGLEISPSNASKSPHKTDALSASQPGFSALPMTDRLRSGEIEKMNFSSGYSKGRQEEWM